MRNLVVFLILNFGSNLAFATVLDTLAWNMEAAEQATSCGLLRHREMEREKVSRELEHLTKAAFTGDERALLFTNNLLNNKLFMAPEDWRDESVEVNVVVQVPKPMWLAYQQGGLDSLFLIIRGPGFVWQSYANQLPDGVQVQVTPDGLLHVSYLTYLNVLCLDAPSVPNIEWLASENIGRIENSHILFERLAASLRKR